VISKATSSVEPTVLWAFRIISFCRDNLREKTGQPTREGEGGAREGGREGKGVDRDRGGERKEKGGRGEGEGGGDRKAKRRGVTDLSFTERNLSRSAALFPSRFKLDLCDSFLAFSKSDLRADRDFLYWEIFSLNTFLVAASWLRISTSICFTKSPAWINNASTCFTRLEDFSREET
jgi:hypothetical protein